MITSFRQRQFITLVILAVLPICVGFLLIANGIRNDVFDRTRTQLNILAENKITLLKTWLTLGSETAQNIGRMHETVVHLPEVLGAWPEDSPDHRLAFEQAVLSTVSPLEHVVDISLLHPETGEIMLSSNTALVHRVWKDRPVFSEGLKNLYIAPVHYSLSHQRAVMHIGCPVLLSSTRDRPAHPPLTEKPAAVVVLELDLDRLQHSLDPRNSHYAVTSFLVDSLGGKLSAHIRQSASGENFGIERLKLRKNGSSVYRDENGEEVLGVYRWLPELNIGLIIQAPVSRITEEIRKSLLGAAGFSVLLLAACIILARIMTGRIMRPIESIAETAGRLEAGELSSRVSDIHADDEIGRLGRSLNTMAQTIEESHRELEDRVRLRTEELSRANRHLVEEIQERRAAELAAGEASRAKSAFLATMSHELRTPLNAVVGMTDLALRATGEAEVRDYLTTAKDSADSLKILIDDLLDFSRIEAHRMEIEAIDFDLHRSLRAIVRTFSAEAEKKALRLRLNIADNVPRYVNSDASRLRQILVNLIGNALKFTDKGSVSLSVALADSSAPHSDNERRGSAAPFRLNFEVADTGPGIPEEKQQTVFEAFRQADSTIARKFGGTGLGLAICRELSGLLGGRLELRSTPGKGSSFIFTAPFRPGDPDHALAAEAPERSSDFPLRPLHVLITEDTPTNAMVSLAILEELGHTAAVAETGADTLETLRNGDFDLVLMDIQLPDIDGVEVTRKIRAGEAGESNSTIPIIALTALALVEFRDRCEDTGMDDYIPKPVSIQDVETALRRNASQFITAPAQAPAPYLLGEHETSAAVPLHDEAPILNNLQGDLDLLADVYTIFLEDTPEIMDSLLAAIDQNDPQAITLHSHALLNTCDSVGAYRCRHFAGNLNRKARNGDQAEIAQDFLVIKDEIERLYVRLAERLATLRPHSS